MRELLASLAQYEEYTGNYCPILPVLALTGTSSQTWPLRAHQTHILPITRTTHYSSIPHPVPTMSGTTRDPPAVYTTSVLRCHAMPRCLTGRGAGYGESGYSTTESTDRPGRTRVNKPGPNQTWILTPARTATGWVFSPRILQGARGVTNCPGMMYLLIQAR